MYHGQLMLENETKMTTLISVGKTISVQSELNETENFLQRSVGVITQRAAIAECQGGERVGAKCWVGGCSSFIQVRSGSFIKG